MAISINNDDICREIEELYRKGFTDGEIGKRLNCGHSTVARWRSIHGYQAYTRKALPMEQALPPEGCELVREFLRMLLFYAGKNEGARIDVGRFMAEWRRVQYGTSSPGQVKMGEAN